MTTKLVICDIDATLVNEKKELTPRTKKDLIQLHEKGIYFGIASGRPADELKRNKEYWDLPFDFDFVVGMNGAELWDGVHQKFYSYFMMKKEWLKETMEIMKVVKCNPMIYWDGKICCVHIDDWMIHSASTSHKELEVVKLEDFYAHENAKIMFRMKEEDMPKAEAWVKEHPNPYYHGFKTQSTLLEFCDKRINKGYGLQKICELNDLDIKDVMAFGDTSNDNDMLKVAGCGVCMINGTDDTKACANAITKQDNEHDGLAIYLEESGILC